MLRTMVFLDYQNFNISLQSYYNHNNKPHQSINYKTLANSINRIIPFQSEVIKTYVFAYKPCVELMQLDQYKKYYSWLNQLKTVSYMEVVEGRQAIRYIPEVQFDINNPSTFYTEEKETDINIATHMITKGYQNAYDIAILISGDTDYVPVLKELHHLGKIVVIAHFYYQNISKYEGNYDAEIIIDDRILTPKY